MSTIFISHSSEDHAAAGWIRDWLEEQGHDSYFLDSDPEKGISAGQRWEEELYRRLRLCRTVIALVSPHWLASRWCFAEVAQARAAGKPVFLVKVAPCSTEQVFSDVQHVDLTADPDDGFRRLARGLREVGVDPRDAFDWDPSRPPYPGLLAFEEEDAAIFFGRDWHIQRTLERLDSLRRAGSAPLVLLLGASGSGKSSLMRAGLIPRLRKESRFWLPLAPFRPQENPVEELAIKLARAFAAYGDARPWAVIYQRLVRSAGHELPTCSEAGRERPSPSSGQELLHLARELRLIAKQDEATVLLAIDQAEELFGYSDSEHAVAFLGCLREALTMGNQRLMALATMRSDALTGFQTHPVLQGFVYETLTVDPIPQRDFARVIEGPARLADVKLEDGLVQTLVRDASTDDALPLLAFSLRELYEHYGEDRRLEIREYEQVGRLEGSVRRAADGAIAAAQPDPAELQALREAFVPAMVRVNAEGDYTRRRALWLDLPPRAHRLLQRFVEARLLVSRQEAGERVVEVSHEALLRNWPRLRRWLREDRNNLRLLEEVRRAAEEWQVNGRKEAWLSHHGERLTAAEAMARTPRFAEQLGQTATAYLSACAERRRQEEERTRRETEAARQRLEAEAAAAAERERAARAEQDHLRTQAAASRQRELDARRITQRTRIGLAAAVALALVAGSFYLNAERARSTAEFQSQIARAREVMAVAQVQEGINTECALNLALEALSVARAADINLVPFVDVLRRSLGEARVEASFQASGFQLDHVAWSPDGKRLAYVDRRARTAIVLEPGSNATRREVPVPAAYAVDWHPRDDVLAVTTEGGDLVLWNFGRDAASESFQLGLADPAQPQWNPEGDQLLLSAFNGPSFVLELKSESLVPLGGRGRGLHSATAWSPDGSRVARAEGTAAYRDILIWSVRDHELTGKLPDHPAGVTGIAWHPKGRLLAAGLDNGEIWLWDADSEELVEVLRGHRNQVFGLAWRSDGELLASGSWDGTIQLWEHETWRQVGTLTGHTSGISYLAWAPDDARVASVDQGGVLKLWHPLTSKEPRILHRDKRWIWDVAWSSDGAYIASATDSSGVLVSRLGAGAPQSFGEGLVSRVAWRPEAPVIAAIGLTGVLHLWDVVAGKEFDSYPLLRGMPGGLPGGLGWSRDGRFLAASFLDTDVISLLDLATDQPPDALRGIIAASLTFSPVADRLAIAAIGASGPVILDLPSRERLDVRFDGYSTNLAMWGIAWSPDGRHLAIGSDDNIARVWDAATGGEPIAVLTGHQSDVKAVAWRPDGMQLATASLDGTVKTWAFPTGRPLDTLYGHNFGARGLAWSLPDGTFLATASEDGQTRIFSMDHEDLIERARKQAVAGLTREERTVCLKLAQLAAPADVMGRAQTTSE